MSKISIKPRDILVYITLLLVGAYTYWVVFFQFDPDIENKISSLGLTTLEFTAAIFGIFLAFQKQIDIRVRRGWLFLGLASLSNAIAEYLWYHFETILGISPFPSIADLFYLLFYPLTLTGVLLLPFKPLKRLEFKIYVFDLSIVVITVIMIFWYFILAPIHLVSEGGLEGVIAIAYPVGDILLFTGVVALVQRNTEKLSRWTLIFIAASVLITTIPDIIFAYVELYELPYTMAYLNIFWMFSALSMVLAVNKQMDTIFDDVDSLSKFSDRSQRLLRITLPYAAAATGPTLLVAVINSSFATGLQLQGLLIGVIMLVVLVLGRQHMVLMDNIQLYEETHKLAITDSLTGIHNRLFFDEALQKEIERSRRYNKPFSILLIDVDNFKAINDTFGHLKGDGVLKVIATILAEQVRETDILTRFGGDEFAIILVETDLAGTHTVARKIESEVGIHSFAKKPLSVSIGDATYQDGYSAERILEEADRQLYKNKLKKNPERIVSASVLV